MKIYVQQLYSKALFDLAKTVKLKGLDGENWDNLSNFNQIKNEKSLEKTIHKVTIKQDFTNPTTLDSEANQTQ